MIRYIFIFLIISSCTKSKTGLQAIPDSLEKDCDRAVRHAIKDYRISGPSYVIVYGMVEIVPYIEELESVAKENGLKVKTEMVSCFEPYYSLCYKAYMDKLLTEEFGKDFIKNLHKGAQDQFAAQRFNKEYDYWEPTKRARVICDTEYCHDDFIDSLNALLGDNRPYTYCGNIIGHSHFSVIFSIDSCGDRTNCTFAGSEFINEEDTSTRREIADLLKNHLSRCKRRWAPAEINGYKVCVKGEPTGVAIRWK